MNEGIKVIRKYINDCKEIIEKIQTNRKVREWQFAESLIKEEDEIFFVDKRLDQLGIDLEEYSRLKRNSILFSALAN